MGVGSIFSRFWYGTLKILFVKTTCTCTLRLIEHMYWCQKPLHEFFRVFSIGFKTPQIEFFARTPFWRYKIWNELLLSKRCSPVASDIFRWNNGAWRAFLNFFGFFRRVLSLVRWVFRANPVKRQIFRTEKKFLLGSILGLRKNRKLRYAQKKVVFISTTIVFDSTRTSTSYTRINVTDVITQVRFWLISEVFVNEISWFF